MNYTITVNITQEIIDKGEVDSEDRKSWRAIARPFSYQLELPEGVQSVSVCK